jgi:hypothetical protein
MELRGGVRRRPGPPKPMTDIDRDEIVSDLRDWLGPLPKSVQILARLWPPGCYVQAHEGKKLIVPAPGIVGEVYSYFENGTLGVVADLPEGFETETDEQFEEGEVVAGQCDPDWLEIVEYGPITAGMVAEALDGVTR